MDNVIRGANWWFDALNTWKALDEVTLPDFARATEAFGSAAGNWEVNWPEGWQAMTATIKLRNNDPDIRALCGREPGDYITAYYYEYLRNYSNGESKGRVIILKGLINSIKDETKQRMKATGIEYEMSTIVLYHDMFEGRSVHKLDYFAGPGSTIIDGKMPFGDMARILAIGGA